MLSLIVPCYNEQEALPFFYKEASEVLTQMGREYEILFVNDGSRDGTLELLRQYAEADPHVIYLSFSRRCWRPWRRASTTAWPPAGSAGRESLRCEAGSPGGFTP